MTDGTNIYSKTQIDNKINYSYTEIENGTYIDENNVSHRIYKRSYNLTSLVLPNTPREHIISTSLNMNNCGILSINGSWINQDKDTIYPLPYNNASGMFIIPTLSKNGVSLSCYSGGSAYTIYSVRINIEYYKY